MHDDALLDDESPLDVHVTIAKVLLAVQAFILGMFALISPLSGAMGGMQDPELKALGPVGAAIVFGLMGILCFGSVGATAAAGAIGLHKERSWGWWCAAIAFGLWLSGCGAPIGIYGLWAIARGDVRRYFGVG